MSTTGSVQWNCPKCSKPNPSSTDRCLECKEPSGMGEIKLGDTVQPYTSFAALKKLIEAGDVTTETSARHLYGPDTEWRPLKDHVIDTELEKYVRPVVGTVKSLLFYALVGTAIITMFANTKGHSGYLDGCVRFFQENRYEGLFGIVLGFALAIGIAFVFIGLPLGLIAGASLGIMRRQSGLVMKGARTEGNGLYFLYFGAPAVLLLVFFMGIRPNLKTWLPAKGSLPAATAEEGQRVPDEGNNAVVDPADPKVIALKGQLAGVVKRYFVAYMAADLDAMLATLHPDGKQYPGPSALEQLRNSAGTGQVNGEVSILNSAIEAMDDTHITLVVSVMMSAELNGEKKADLSTTVVELQKHENTWKIFSMDLRR